MATNKHAIIRYRSLDKCFRNIGRRYSIDDLVDACNEAIFNFSGIDEGVKKRQIYDDISFMMSEEGWNIPLEKIKDGKWVYYRYTDRNFSINNQPLNEAEANQLKEVLCTLQRFKGMPQFEWIEEIIARLESSFDLLPSSQRAIEFEQNQYLKGLNFLSELFHAIVYKKVVQINYKSFRQIETQQFAFHSHYLKQYNSRWFVFGFQDNRDDLTNLALDRIIDIKEIQGDYRVGTTDFSEYFEDIIGVTIPKHSEIEKILVKVSPGLWPYIESKPIHGSQKTKFRDESGALIEISVYVNYELISLLLSYADSIEIIEPERLRETLREKANRVLKKYS